MAELKTKQHDGDVFEFINNYAKKLSDINIEALTKLIRATINYFEDKYGSNQ